MVFTTDRLIRALANPAPIQLTVDDEDELMPVTLHYTDGLRYPRLACVEGTPDRLAEILTPLTPPTP